MPGRSAGAGFVSLLRRGVPRDRVLDVCLQEWRKSFEHGTRFTPREKAAVEEIAQSVRDADPVADYKKICAALVRNRGGRGA
jgi:hypothetical protein